MPVERAATLTRNYPVGPTHHDIGDGVRRGASTLDEVFLGGEPGQGPDSADAGARERWRTRYMAALERFQEAGVKPIADPAGGFETYASRREFSPVAGSQDRRTFGNDGSNTQLQKPWFI